MIIGVQLTDKPNVYCEPHGEAAIKPDLEGVKSRLFVGDRAFETAEAWVKGKPVWSAGEFFPDEKMWNVMTTHNMPTSGLFHTLEDVAKFCNERNKI